jgi:hypothetical protein
MKKRSLIVTTLIVTTVVVLCVFYFGGLAIGNMRQIGIIPTVNGSTITTTIEVKINENFLRGDSLVNGWSYSYQYFYSGWRYDAYSGAGSFAVFTAVGVATYGGPTPMQFYVHTGESFTLYGKTYTLKSVNNSSVTLEVS